MMTLMEQAQAPQPTRTTPGWRKAAAATWAAITLFSVPSAQADTALLSNGSFESGLSGWSVTGGAALSTAAFFDGTSSAALADTGTGAALSLQLATAVAVADITAFNFAALNGAGIFSEVEFRYSDTSTSTLLVEDFFNAAWTRYSLLSGLVSGKTLTGFTLFGDSGGTVTYIDDVVLRGNVIQVPEPATWMLSAAGGLFVATHARRRRRTRH